MTAEVPTLGECFLTLGTGEGPLSSMLTEVVPQIAALFENRATTSVPTSEI